MSTPSPDPAVPASGAVPGADLGADPHADSAAVSSEASSEASSAVAEPACVAWPDPARRAAFEAWLAPVAARHGLLPRSLRAASADASFRRYLRIDAASGGSFVVMDAPPPTEDVRPFLAVRERLQAAGLQVPAVPECDLPQGFLLMQDLGDRLLLDELARSEAASDAAATHDRMLEAIDTLVHLQSRCPAQGLASYDDAMLDRELELFPQWCVQRDRGIEWSARQQEQWGQAKARLIESARAQATVFVHRDFMPRNLMLPPQGGLAILDFQDAVSGPITYDLASLLRDAFISWDEEREIDWAVRYWERARKAGLPVDDDFGELWRRLEWMGLQRHLKVLGIFCRLQHRDGKPRYRADLPRFFAYAHKVAARYNGLGPLAALLEQAAGTERRAGFTF